MAQYKGAASEAARALQMQKRRIKAMDDLEEKKAKIVIENQIKANRFQQFSAHYDAVEAKLKSSTVGLLTLDEMKKRQESLIREREKQIATSEESKLKNEKNVIKKEKTKQKSALSFTFDDEEDDEEDDIESNKTEISKLKMKKNPDVDTSFLPDRERESEDNKLREKLRKEWAAKQESLKNEEIEITYSYWDGSGHRRKLKVIKFVIG